MSVSAHNLPFHKIDPPDAPLSLTEREREFYAYLARFVDERGRWPTYGDLCDHFGFTSENSVSQFYKQLVAKGWIVRPEAGEYRFAVGRCPFCGSDLADHGEGFDVEGREET